MTKTPLLINCSYVDKKRKLSLPGFFRIVEDTDTVDAEKIGVGKAESMDKGRLWVFTRVYFEFYRYPDYLEEVEVETYSAPRQAFVFPRFDTIYDKKGHVLCKGSTYWALLDENTRHAVFRPDFDTPDYRRGEEMKAPEKIAKQDAEFVREHLVTYSDIDLNRHMNNTRYIELIIDSIDPSFLDTHEVASILINYDMEIHAGERVRLFASNDFTYLRGEVDGNVCFQALLSYR